MACHALLPVPFGAARARHFAFPILFFLVAVPWPTVIEHPTVQFLTRTIVTATVEVLNKQDVPRAFLAMYDYAWFTGFVVAFVAYCLLDKLTPLPRTNPI